MFEYEYLREYEAKIENIYTLVYGPQDVLLGMKNSKNRVRWTVPLSDLHLTALPGCPSLIGQLPSPDWLFIWGGGGVGMGMQPNPPLVIHFND